MPYVRVDSSSAPPVTKYSSAGRFGDSVSNSIALPADVQEQLTRRLFNQANSTNLGVSTPEVVGRWAVGTVVDLADSIYGNRFIPGTERGNIWSLLDGTEEKDFYERNRGMIEGSSAIAGLVGTALAGNMFVLPRIASGLASSTFLTGTRAWQLGAAMNASTRAGMEAAMLTAAQAGQKYSMWSLRYGTAGLKFAGWSAAKGAGVGLVEEAMMYGVMNANDFAYTSDAASNMFFAGLGVGAGAAVGTVMARAQVRQFANSPRVRDLRATSLDTLGAGRILTEGVSGRATAGETGNWRLKESAQYTDFMVGARAMPAADAPDELRTLAKQIASESDRYAERSLQKMIINGIDGVQVEKGTWKEIPEWQAAHELAKDDPFLFFGMDRGGVLKKSVKESLQDQVAYIEQLRKEANVLETRKGLPQKARELRTLALNLEKQEGKLLIGGSWYDINDSKAAQLASYNRAETHFTPASGDVNGFSFRRTDGRTQRIDDSFGVHSLDFEKLSVVDQMRTVEALSKIQARMLREKTPYVVSKETVKKGNWFALDAALEFAKKGGRVELGQSGLATLEDLRLAALQAKATAVMGRFGASTPITTWDRLAYNLPLPKSLERIEDPAGDTIREWLKGVMATKGMKSKSAGVLLSELEEALENARAIQGFDATLMRGAKGASHKPSMVGDLFNWNRGKKGEFLRPIAGFFDTENNYTKLAQQTLAEDVARNKLFAVAQLRKLPQGNHVRDLTDLLMMSPETEIAQRTLGLADDQITGTGGGLAQLASEVLTQRMRYRDNPTMLAAATVNDRAQRAVNEAVIRVMKESGLADDFTAINSVGRQHHKVMLDQWFSNRPGWDLEPEPVRVKGDKWAFELSDSENNKLRLGLNPDEELEPGTLLRNARNGNIIALDDFALGFVEKFNKVSTGLLLETDNALRAAVGGKAIRSMPFFAPSPNTNRALIAFVFDESENVVKGRTIVAKSEEEFRRLKEKTREDLVKEFGPSHGYDILDKTHIESMRRDLRDKLQLDWIDPVETFRPGGSQTGGLAGAFVNPNATADAIDWIRRKLTSQINDTVETLFADNIAAARMQAQALRATRSGSIIAGKETRSIFDEYETTLLGRANAYQAGSITGRPLREIEASLNRLLAKTPLRASAQWVGELAERMGVPTKKIRLAKSYDELVKVLGEYSPYKNALDYAEQTLGVKVPKDTRKLVEKMSWISASTMLRWDVSHAAMNMLGIIATLPTLINSGRAPITVGFKLSNGQRVGAIDTAKIFANSFNDMISTRSKADWEFMLKNGDASQQIVEYNMAMAAVTSQHGWRKWANQADKWLSFLSTNSENWSRQWAHFAGLRIADYHGIQGMTARHDFAREIANAAIADYSPVNRPELFQTGLGSMYGQFMSYMLNQNMKLFRWMENGQFKEFASGLAMQASLFGVLGVPAARQLVGLYNAVTQDGGGQPTGIDRIYAQFGPVAGSVLANGGMNLFGLAFHTRGDLTIRTPSIDKASDLLTNAPAISILAKVANTVTETIGIVLEGHTPTMGAQIMEVVTREMPNRIARGWLSVLQGGREIDPYGNIAAETRDWLDTTARIIGLRSTRQQAELEQYYLSRAEADKDAARMDRTRKRLRTATRQSLENGTEIDVIGFFNEYVKNGGNPANFRTWLRNTVREAGSARAVNALHKSLKSPSSHLEAWRFGAYGASR